MIKAGLKCPRPNCRLTGWRCLECLLKLAKEDFYDIDGNINLEIDSGKSFFEYSKELPDSKIINTIIDKRDWLVSTIKGDFNANVRNNRPS